MYLLALCITAVAGSLHHASTCYEDGVAGRCTPLHKCQTAINYIMNGKDPQICYYKHGSPIVCCITRNSYQLITTTQRGWPYNQYNIKSTVRPYYNPADTAKMRPVVTSKINNVTPQSTMTSQSTLTTTPRNNKITVPMDFTDIEDYVENILSKSTTENTPNIDEYVAQLLLESKCPSSPKTGNKAKDKCVEYREKLVFPCEEVDGEIRRKGHCQHIAETYVIGGKAAARHEFPHMVLLGYGDQKNHLDWKCGGSLISERFVLTAGHCIVTSSFGPVTYVLVDALSKNESADLNKIHKVKRYIKHPDYKHASKYNDIALLETETEINLSQYIVPGCLPFEDKMEIKRASATGWGHTAFAGSASEELLKVTLEKFETEVCATKFPIKKYMKRGFDEKTQMCYGDKKERKDTCQGDSGGPLQIKAIDCMYVIIGVTSFGNACGVIGEPGVYTRVAEFVPWIEGIVWP